MTADLRWLCLALSVNILRMAVSESGQLECPKTSEPCAEYSEDPTINRDTWYYFESDLGDCVALRSDCEVPVREVVFSSISQCRDSCGVTDSPDSQIGGCNSTLKGCGDEIAEDTSGSASPVMVILAVIGTVGIVAVVAVILVATFSLKKQQQVQNRRYEDVLQMLAETSDSEESSLSDNPEENNLFDRLERNW